MVDKVQGKKQIVEYHLQLFLNSDNLWVYKILLYKDQHT